MTATTFSVNSNNDIFIGGNGNLSIVYDLQATLQVCAHATKTILGEMVLSIREGIPEFETVWIGSPNLQQYESAIRSALLQVVGVVEIVSFILGKRDGTILNSMSLTYTAVIRTIYGVGAING